MSNTTKESNDKNSQPKLSVRLVSADSYQSPPLSMLDSPFSEFRGSEIKYLPVIRIFGTTSTGEKICLHIHGIFPYIYIPCTSDHGTDNFMYRLASALDTAINISLGSSNSNTQHIYKIQLVTGIPLYGYHKKKHKFYKIYFYNPAMVKRATELLQNGSVMSTAFQPHEAHIPFILQFMIDYNIYGMSFVHLNDFYYRKDCQEQQLSGDLFSDENDEEDKKYLPNSIAKQSVCELEVDATAQNIINRQAVQNGVVTNPGIAAIWEEEKLRRLLAGLPVEESQMACPISLERVDLPPTDNDVYQQERFNKRLHNVTQSNESDTSADATNFLSESYPIQANENEDVLNASNVEDHLSGSQMNESGRIPSSQGISEDELNNSIGPGDITLINILADLAKESESEGVDDDSILGSQPNDLPDNENLSDEDDDVPDLNLTNLQLDSLSPWDIPNDNTLSQKSASSTGTIPSQMFEEDFTDFNIERVENRKKTSNQNIPAYDGNYDSTDSEEEPNVTVVEEVRVCSYNPSAANTVNCTTPGKRKIVTDEIINSASKKKKLMSIHKTPTRSPSRRRISLSSPSSSRTYSPLNIQITTSPKIKENLLAKKAISEQKKKELEVLKSIQKKQEVSILEKLEDQEILAENSDDSTTKGTSTSPILSRQKVTKVKKTVARKLQFSKNPSSENSKNSSESFPQNKEIILETSEEASSSDLEGTNETPLTSAEHFVTEYFPELLLDTQTSEGILKIVPKFKPPSKERIIATMELYDIPKCRYQEPFYENSEDVDGQKEMAHKILKVQGKGMSSLQTFTSNLEDIKGIVHWRNSRIQIFENSQSSFRLDKFSNDKKNLAGHSILKITPLMMPPSRRRVVTWLKARKYLQKKKLQEQKSNEKSTTVDLALEIKSFREDNDDDNDKTICGSTCSSSINGDDTLVESKINEIDEIVNNNINAIDATVEVPEISDKVNSEQIDENSNKENGKLNQSSSSEFESSVDLSVKRALEDTNFLKSVRTSKHFGVSCGQIEFLSDSTRLNVDQENFHAKALAKNQFITMMCLEVHVDTREDLVPDPQQDAIKIVFYAIQNDVPVTSKITQLEYGAIILNTEPSDYIPKNCIKVKYLKTEEQIIEEVISLVQKWDPEILIGWEIEYLSWGYIFQRAAVLGMQFSSRISRIPKIKHSWEPKTLEWDQLADFKLPGRIVLEIWRTMRHEIALYSYTFENVMFHIMNERLPYYSWKTLTQFWVNPNRRSRCKVIDYYVNRVLGNLRMLEQLDIIGRTSEFARLYGVQFYEVFSRGSQFRVESMMLRLAKPLNYIPVSPSNTQRAAMRAPEALPLIMEPESCLYNDPLVVLDFQSLYPSIIIAYNYCFSTCLGRVEYMGQSRPFTLGAYNLKVTKKLARELQGKINFSPVGVGFVNQEVRKGILPQMLQEILNTRLMVKKAIKDHSSEDKTLQRVLHSRQLGLKLIANVTYGYTAANFSGRMPCIEVGDSVVSKGKETLERAIKIVESNKKWGARVVYGDTDSLFILLRGKTREEAFIIGNEMADVVTQANPPPVKLKFEKVLQPAILQTKKRYCGYMYENRPDEKPVYLGKGLETVRRDGCPAVAKILQKTLKILFETKDVSQIKQYVTRQFDKILQGKVSIEDLTFAREFRGLRGYRPNACVPALELTKRLMKHDPKSVPRNHTRVRYVIVAGAPNEALIRCVRTPMEVVSDPGLRPNAIYYITRVIIPPLNRCLNLIGADAHVWFNKMPHRLGHKFLENVIAQPTDKQKITISQYFGHAMCAACGKQTTSKEICEDCKLRPGETMIILNEKLRQMERVHQLIASLCHTCIGQVEPIKCESLDCPVFYRRAQTTRDFTGTYNIHKIILSGSELDF